MQDLRQDLRSVRRVTPVHSPVHVIGGGLSGSEAAWQLARCGVPVVLHEMRPVHATPVHKTGQFAELVCSNSFRSDDAETQRDRRAACRNAPLRLADHARGRCPQTAGRQRARGRPRRLCRRDHRGARSRTADRNRSRGNWRAARRMGQRHHRHRPAHLAGAGRIPFARCTGEDALSFFDAIAPIVHRDSIDFDVAWFQSRYDKPGPGGSGADYINCPLTREQYDAFIDALLAGEKTAFHEFEIVDALFRRLPADRSHGRARARDAASRADEAVRPDRSATAGAQALCRGATAPGQQARLAVQHGGLSDQAPPRRTGPRLSHHSRRSSAPSSRGSAGCTATPSSIRRNCSTRRCGSKPSRACALPDRSPAARATSSRAAIGLLAGRFAAAERLGDRPFVPPPSTAHGALLGHITGGHIETIDAGPSSFQPMNVNFGLFPPLSRPPTTTPTASGCAVPAKAVAKKRALCARALNDLETWLAGALPAAAE